MAAGNFLLRIVCVCMIFFQQVQTRSVLKKRAAEYKTIDQIIQEVNNAGFDGNSGPARRAAYQPPPKLPEHETIDQMIEEVKEDNEAVNHKMGGKAKNGLVEVELDMELTPQQYAHLYCHGSECKSKRKATSDVSTRWPNGVIPYEINYRDFSYEETQELKQALAEWQNFTCLQFRQASGGDKNKVKYQNGAGCNSMVGMVGGTQIVNLQSPGCRSKGLYLHETGHAIGLLHEHQLPQRDDYIRIDYSVVGPNLRDSFKKYSPDAVQALEGIEYDYASVMHYGKTAFSYDGMHQTIYTKDPKKERLIGFVAEKGLSFFDIKAVNMLYKCNAKCDPQPSCKNPCFVNKDCKCFCKEDMPKVPCVDKETDSSCADWASRGECNKNKDFMELKCRKTCGICTVIDEDTDEPEQEVCINKHGDEDCNEWKERGDCDNNAEFLHKNCRKACGLCTSGEGKPATPGKKPEPCVNDAGDRDCTDWAKRGECKANPSFMLKSCRKACGECKAPGEGSSSGKATESDSSCRDEDKLCGAWKKYCGSNEHVTSKCAKTCGSCR